MKTNHINKILLHHTHIGKMSSIGSFHVFLLSFLFLLFSLDTCNPISSWLEITFIMNISSYTHSSALIGSNSAICSEYSRRLVRLSVHMVHTCIRVLLLLLAMQDIVHSGFLEYGANRNDRSKEKIQCYSLVVCLMPLFRSCLSTLYLVATCTRPKIPIGNVKLLHAKGTLVVFFIRVEHGVK